MTDSENSTPPKGIFDRSTTGVKTRVQRVEIERGQIKFFAKSIGETNPIHLSTAAARENGYADIVAPITFPIAISMIANEQLTDIGEQSGMSMINCDYRRLLHGSERYDYSGLIIGGDVVDVQTEVAGFEDKKGGMMELAFLKTTISHCDRGKLVTMTSTAIHRLG